MIPGLRDEFWKNVNVPGTDDELNQYLEHAGRVADFMEFGELLCHDALHARRIVRRPFPRGISDPDGEAKRDDEQFRLRRRLGIRRRRQRADLQRRAIDMGFVKPSVRSYK